ncbi:MAG: hypothetical protein WD886_07750 [Burkholderiales bacterium]
MTASGALLAAFALAIGILLLALRPRVHAIEHVRLYDMMRLRGVSPPRSSAAARDVAAAEHRCAACASKPLCDELLRNGSSDGYHRFCPNALYLEWLHSNSLNFD